MLEYCTGTIDSGKVHLVNEYNLCTKGHELSPANVGTRDGRKYCMSCLFDVLKSNLDETDSYKGEVAGIVTPDHVLRVVCQYYKMDKTRLVSASRSKHITEPRHVAMALCLGYTSYSSVELGSLIFKRNHSTILVARDKVKKRLTEDPVFKNRFWEIERVLKSKRDTDSAIVTAQVGDMCIACGSPMQVERSSQVCRRCGYSETCE